MAEVYHQTTPSAEKCCTDLQKVNLPARRNITLECTAWLAHKGHASFLPGLSTQLQRMTARNHGTPLM